MSVSGMGVAATAGGALLVWSGIKGASVTGSLKDLISGSQPTGTVANPVTLTSFSGTTAASQPGAPAGIVSGAGQGAGTPKGHYDHAGQVLLWQQAGGSASTANNAACHAIQESGGNPSAENVGGPGPGCTAVGLWQLATPCGVGGGHSIGQLKNPLLNARLTVQATRNGRDWSQWATAGC